MIRISEVSLPLDYNENQLKTACAKALKCSESKINQIFLVKKGIDARKKNNVHFSMTFDVSVKGDQDSIIKKASSQKIFPAKEIKYDLPHQKKFELSPVIIGAGPAGLFCAYILALAGAEPIIIERGSDVDKRKKDIEDFQKNRILNENSNVQFGEGGAGTFSDGKLNTGIKDPRIKFVLQTFCKFGSPEEIMYSAKPHIGTDNLSLTIKNMRNEIISLGGKFLFNTTLKNLIIKNGEISACETERDNKTEIIPANCVILAIGHSSRDTFEMLQKLKIPMEQKPFAIGARIEHIQQKINISQYGSFANHKSLGAADYKLFTHLKNGRCLYTFCMCPGGTVVGAASEKNSVVTNGMSYYARNLINSNSALLVNVSPEDFKSDNNLAGMYFQRKIEKSAFELAGANYNAPVQRLDDFINNKKTTALGEVKPSYLPGTSLSDISDCLPDFICDSIKHGIKDLGQKLKGFDDGDALLTAPETRSSSPVRILRSSEMQSVKIKGLYPCGEGAGYAGGITSAAVDGIKCAERIVTDYGT